MARRYVARIGRPLLVETLGTEDATRMKKYEEQRRVPWVDNRSIAWSETY